MESKYIALIPALPLLGAALNLLVGRKLPRRWVHRIAVGSVVAALGVAVYLIFFGPLWDLYGAWSAAKFPAGGGEGAAPEAFAGLHQSVWTWIEIGDFKLNLAFHLDTLAAVMVLVITFVGSLIHIYSTGYMAHEPRYAAYFGYLNLFTGAMLILVLGDSLPVMFIGWEGVGLCSYLLIGFWFTEEANANAGRKAFIVNRVGDFGFLLGICLLYWATGSMTFSDYQSPDAASAFMQNFLGGERLAAFAGILLFVGACGKSAQIPLYVWLPDAMAGPTPVSALIHAATMVTAGVYMVARLSFLYAHSTTAMAVVAGVGALTALFAAIMAFAQTDFKKVLAYSTVSQLGFMFVGVGVGAYTAGIFHLMTHAFFKAGLFLAAGSVMHAMSGSGDIMRMGGLRKKLPWTHATFVIYWLAIAGIFPFAGFFSKDEILAGAFGADAQGWASVFGEVLWVVLSLAALGTAFYMSRLYFLVFAGECRADDETRAHIHESPRSMTMPLVVLAAFTCVIGFLGLPHLSSIPEKALILQNWLDGSLIDFSRESLAGSIPEHHASTASTIALMGIALVAGLVGIAAAWFLYRTGPSAVVERMTSGGFRAWCHKVVANKFFVDELYEKIIIGPFRWMAQMLFEVFDRFVIDLLIVSGSAFLVDVAGKVARWVQNGQVQRYLVAVILGAALILHCSTSPELNFTVEQLGGNRVAITPDIGAGAAADGALIEFDFNYDGEPDAEPVRFNPQEPLSREWAFGSSGEFKVTMWVTDAVNRERRKLTKTIRVEAPGVPDEGAGAEAGGAQ